MAIYNNDRDPNEVMWERQNQTSAPVKVSWQKCMNMYSEIEYLKEENPGEYYFSIKRRELDGWMDVEEDECYAFVVDGIIIDYEGYSRYPSLEEEGVMKAILKEKNIL